jgi:hypothetical protein
MKKYSQPQRIVAIIMIFVILPQFTGCVTSKIIAVKDLPVVSNDRYVIHVRKAYYEIDSTHIENGILSGRITSGESVHNKNAVNLYLLSDTLIKITPQNILSLPVSEITQIKEVKPSSGKTVLLVTGIVVVFIILMKNTIRLDFNPLPNGI